MVRVPLAALATTCGVLLAACGSETNDSGQEASAPLPSPSDDDSGFLTDEEIEELAEVIVGRPSGYSWVVRTVPSSWEEVETEDADGVRYQVPDTTCVVTLWSRSGIPPEDIDAEWLINDIARDIGSEVQSSVEVRNMRTQLFDAVRPEGPHQQLPFTAATLTDGQGVDGEVLTYMSPDTTLSISLVAMCQDDQFDAALADDLDAFVAEELQVQVTYESA